MACLYRCECGLTHKPNVKPNTSRFWLIFRSGPWSSYHINISLLNQFEALHFISPPICLWGRVCVFVRARIHVCMPVRRAMLWSWLREVPTCPGTHPPLPLISLAPVPMTSRWDTHSMFSFLAEQWRLQLNLLMRAIIVFWVPLKERVRSNPEISLWSGLWLVYFDFAKH